MKIAMLIPDNRDEFHRFADPEPYFGQAPSAVLEGLADIRQCEVHIVCCTHRPLRSPAQIAGNIFYHSSVVPSWGWLKGGYLGCVRAIKSKLREIKPDIVHGQGTERYCALAAVRSGCPNVLTLHGNMRNLATLNKLPPFSYGWLAARWEAFALPRTGGVFCNSLYTEELVRPRAKRIWRVPNALQKRFFAPPAASAPGTVPVLLNIGVIEPRKEQNEILEMAGRLFGRGARFRLNFIGRLDEGSSYGARFRELIRQARTSGYADYLGEKSTADVISLMDNADALVHAPTEESFGLVVAEALARNLRLFGFKVGGLLDIAGNDEAAVLVEPGDFGALEEETAKWLAAGHPKASGGAERMRARYHPDVIARRHMEIYREVLGGK